MSSNPIYPSLRNNIETVKLLCDSLELDDKLVLLPETKTDVYIKQILEQMISLAIQRKP